MHFTMQPTIAHDLESKVRTRDVVLDETVNFASMLLSSNIKNGLTNSGFKKPSPIQLKAIPLGRCGFDLIVKSKSGTGKTLVFTTIVLETVNVTKNHLQVLILVPTREIAVQIQDVIRSIGCYIDGLSVQSFIGGMPLEEDITKAKTCHIAVGAPGRVKHLINLGALSTKSVKLFVLDEADKLMESSFKSDINEIYDSLPIRKQIIASSATYPKELDTFLSKYMLSPTHVTSENETPLLLGLKQFVAVIQSNAINAIQQMKAKNEILLQIFSKVSYTQCLVFTNYQTRTESVSNFLNQNGWNASFISAAIDQNGRLEAINNLKTFKSRILLSTDLTSRGIDASNVDLVINYDLPHDAVTYLHRMGRAGRYGSTGICINFALEGIEIKKMQNILGTIGSTNLSISKLPQLSDIDLWQVDSKNLEQIWGVVPSETDIDIKETIKKEVIMMKQSCKKENNTRKKKIKLEELSKENVEVILKNKDEEIDDTVNAEDVLLMLTQFNEEDTKKRKRNDRIKLEDLSDSNCDQAFLGLKKEKCDTSSEDVLSSLITNSETTSQDENKKRKLDDSILRSFEDEIDCKEKLFLRNRALLNVTKLLYDRDLVIDKDVVKTIENHLVALKSDSFDNLQSESVEEILNKTNVTAKIEEMIDGIENIFQIGYQCAVANDGNNLLALLPNDELEKFQNFCRSETVEVSDDELEEESEDLEMDAEEEEEPQENAIVAQAAGVPSQWLPNVPNEGHYMQCFEDCSNVLWQTGLTFESVENFDNWYVQWQQQLDSVRNYVQQNIYINEMSQYQHNRVISE